MIITTFLASTLSKSVIIQPEWLQKMQTVYQMKADVQGILLIEFCLKISFEKFEKLDVEKHDEIIPMHSVEFPYFP